MDIFLVKSVLLTIFILFILTLITTYYDKDDNKLEELTIDENEEFNDELNRFEIINEVGEPIRNE
jgi:hypothetical protein